MFTRIALTACLFLAVSPMVGHSEVITIRTGQVGGMPGTCPGVDDNFRFYAPNPDCAAPILPGPFQPSDFDQACAGPQAVLVGMDALWTTSLPSDPLARWINCYRSGCYAAPSRSVLYCAPFQVLSGYTVADSIRIYWAVDNELGDFSDGGPIGPNPDGVYIDGISLGSGFRAGGFYTEHTGVVYDVPINSGSHHLEVYSRNINPCVESGLMLSCTLYMGGGPVSVQAIPWGSIKAMYR